jgi:hypothetical protein
MDAQIRPAVKAPAHAKVARLAKVAPAPSIPAPLLESGPSMVDLP